MELIERKPRSEIDKAGAVEDKIKDSRERIAFGLFLEMTIPRDGATCSRIEQRKTAWKGANTPAANAARRSSFPSELAAPAVNNARAKYWAIYDSRSRKSF